MKGKPGAMGKGKMTFGSEKKMPNTNKGKTKPVAAGGSRLASENKPSKKNMSGSKFGLL